MDVYIVRQSDKLVANGLAYGCAAEMAQIEGPVKCIQQCKCADTPCTLACMDAPMQKSGCMQARPVVARVAGMVRGISGYVRRGRA